VLIGRRTALARPFEQMIEDFTNALQRLERQRPTPALSTARGRGRRDRTGRTPAGGRKTPAR
jgi:hypothetical protein